MCTYRYMIHIVKRKKYTLNDFNFNFQTFIKKNNQKNKLKFWMNSQYSGCPASTVFNKNLIFLSFVLFQSCFLVNKYKIFIMVINMVA